MTPLSYHSSNLSLIALKTIRLIVLMQVLTQYTPLEILQQYINHITLPYIGL